VLVQCYSVPLVGVWVKGVEDPTHPLVAAACLRFRFASTLPDRALQQGSAHLLLLFPPGRLHPHGPLYVVL
jgi:hypothetical protein